MAQNGITRGEAIGLGIALAGHVALVAVLVMAPSPPRPLPPQRMQVTLSDEVGREATSPSREEAASDVAPQLGEQPQESQASQPAPTPKAEPKPAPQPAPKPAPAPIPVPRPVPQPAPAKPAPAKPIPAQPTPTKPAPAKPEPRKPSPAKADPIGAALAKAQTGAAKASPGKATTAPTKAPAGGMRLGPDFLKGVAASGNGKAQTPPAAAISPHVKAALASAISRQLKPYWRVPQGVDTDQLVTILAFDLNPDGTLAGPVTLVRQEGITPSNRPQAALHRENAMRAIKLAAPFPLPPDLYEAWKHVQWRFDRNLSQ